ncbi:MAG TPA: hypothetical protein VHV32_09750 [Candidatus Angelobacter sp.]|nr:hypothetical protein [Candidatus Angelobacter sp.]
MRLPDKAETERENKKFQEHMKDLHEREGGRHKDCGPQEKDDEDDHGRGHGHGHKNLFFERFGWMRTSAVL